jgi:hypothetical protein
MIIACVTASLNPKACKNKNPIAGIGNSSVIFTFKPVVNKKVPRCHWFRW